jgi:hypothetical protein
MINEKIGFVLLGGCARFTTDIFLIGRSLSLRRH